MRFRHCLERFRRINEILGRGVGVGGPRQRSGGADMCVCPNPKCGHEIVHKRGIPCNKQVCPKCGTRMVGKNSAV